jgi:hypothetical protein
MDGAGGRVGISLANSDDSLQVTAKPVFQARRPEVEIAAAGNVRMADDPTTTRP